MDRGCRKENVAVDKRVREAGLRPTRQRIALADLLFALAKVVDDGVACDCSQPSLQAVAWFVAAALRDCARPGCRRVAGCAP